jgi:hypothetical protein
MAQYYNNLKKQFVIWLGANILGFIALGVFALVLPLIIHFSSRINTVFIIALPISIAQWIALRYLLKISLLWILTVPIGILVGQVVINFWPRGFWPNLDDEAIANIVIIFLIVGVSVGITQWLLLQRKVKRSLLWIAGSAIGVAASIWIILVMNLINLSGFIAYFVAVLVYSSITGATLAGIQVLNNKSKAYPVSTSLS